MVRKKTEKTCSRVEAAKVLGVSAKTVGRMAERGQLEMNDDGTFDVIEIAAFMDGPPPSG